MRLESIIRKLRQCHGEDEGGNVFLLARDERPADQTANRPTDRAQDKDIWSLVGPIDLEEHPRHFLVDGKGIAEIEEALAGIEPGDARLWERADRPRPGCGQQIFILVQHRGGQRAQDKDIWSLSGPMPSRVLVSRFPSAPVQVQRNNGREANA